MRLLIGCLVFLLSACGGGNGTGPISEFSAGNLRYGQTATITLRGSQLDHDITLIADSEKCIGVTLAPATSANTRTATCIVVGTGPAFFTVRSHAGYVLYTTTLHIPEPVTRIRSDNLGFGRVTLTLEGDPHTAAIRLSSDKCRDISLAAVSSGSSRTATCTLLTSGPVRFDVTNPNGSATLYSQTLNAAPPTGLVTWNTQYGQKAYVAVPASDTPLQLNSSQCIGAAVEAALSNADTQVMSCTIANVGAAPLTVTNASGATLYQANVAIPDPQVTLVTNLGSVVMEFNPLAARATVDNFLAYVNQSPSFYNGTIFHRVMPGFVVQGGGFTSGTTMAQKTGLRSPIALESNNGLSNDRGTVAMARTDAPDSATSQFFVNLVNNASLNYASPQSPGYTVFGRVVAGMDVVDRMAQQPTRTVGTHQNVPVTDITVLSASQTR